MRAFGQLVLVIGVLASIYPAVREQWIRDRAGSIKTIRLFIAYMIYIFAGLGLLITMMPRDGGGSTAGIMASLAFILGWILYGASMLTKSVPRYRPLPEWVLEPFSIIDKIAVGTILVSVVILLV